MSWRLTVLKTCSFFESILRKIPVNKPLVVDADGLWFLSESPPDIRLQLSNCTVLTPNSVEFSRLQSSPLFEKLGEDFEIFGNCLETSDGEVSALVKGATDELYCPYTKTYEHIVCEFGMARRAGGQGDVLAGILITLLSWVSIKSRADEPVGWRTNHGRRDNAVKCATFIIRQAQSEAFSKNFRGTLASDVILEIPKVVNFMLNHGESGGVLE